MEEAASLNSKKRKHPSSSSSHQLQGIFTRSRSELFLHRTRSGRARADSSCSRNLIIQRLGSSSSPSSAEDSINHRLHPDEVPGIGSHVSIKDLRARRVFSPTTTVVGGDCSPNKKTDDPDDDHTKPVSSTSAREVEEQFDGLGEECKSQPTILVGPEIGSAASVCVENKSIDEGFWDAMVDDNIQVQNLGSFMDQNREIRGDPDGDIRFVLSDLSRIVGFGVGGEEFLQATPLDSDSDTFCKSQSMDGGWIADGDIFRESQPADDWGILELPGSIGPDSVVENPLALSGGSCHDRMEDENIPAMDQGSKIQADPDDHMKPEVLDVPRGIEFDGWLGVLGADGLSGEECIQTTPPDNDILRKSELLNLPSVKVSGENSSFVAGFCQANVDEHIPVKKREGSLGPHSRLKLFQTPNSLSYRRMLPFLMDIAKDNARALEIHPCPDHRPVNPAKIMEERPLQPAFDSLLTKTNSDSSKTDPLPVQPSFDGLAIPHAGKAKEISCAANSSALCVVECPNQDSSSQPSTESPSHSPLENPFTSYGKVASVPTDVYCETALQLDPDVPESTRDCLSSIHDMELPCMLPNPLISHDTETGSSVIEGNIELDGANDSSEEWFKTMPDVGDVSFKAGRSVDRGNVGTLDSIRQPCILDNQSRAKASTHEPCNMERICHTKDKNTSVKNTLGLAPCSRLKLIQTPNSLSYRRLLPFLMDLTNDNANLPESQSSQEFSPVELDKAVEETPLPSLLDSLSHDSDISSHKIDLPPLQQLSNDPATSQTEKHEIPSKGSSGSSMLWCSHIDTSEQPTTEITNQKPPENPVVSCDLVITAFSNPSIETALQQDRVPSESSSELAAAYDALVSVHETELPCNESLIPLVRQEALVSADDSGSDIRVPCNFLRESDVDRHALVPTLAIDVKPLDMVDIPQHSSQVNAPVPSERFILTPAKGILKKNPRACRHFCMCQNCASVCLHSEKANEFLKKQIQDANEVAKGLMKELSCLRSWMEESFSPKSGSTEDHAVFQINQIKGFCRRASRAEELARSRLKKMTYDFKDHCRIATLQRPRVRFADHVQEKLIPKSETEDGG